MVMRRFLGVCIMLQRETKAFMFFLVNATVVFNYTSAQYASSAVFT